MGLQNGSFELGWHHPSGIPELQIPDHWQFWYSEGDNQYSPTNFIRPEVRVLPSAFLPEHERPIFILDGDQCIKVFKGSAPWYGAFFQSVALTPGKWTFTVNIYGDLVEEYTPAGKNYSQDPDAGKVRFGRQGVTTDWQRIIPGQYNTYSYTFDIHASVTQSLGVDIMCPLVLDNSGIFADKWSLTKISAPDVHDRYIHLVPTDITDAELSQVVAVAKLNRASITWDRHTAFATYLSLHRRHVTIWAPWRQGGTKAIAKWAVERYPPWPHVTWRRFETAIWDQDVSNELATNPGPYTDSTLQSQGGWWKRQLAQIDGVTIHHTLSNSPHATAGYYVSKEGGRPTLPYTFWVTQEGRILKCVELTEGLWHDHTGNRNTHLSVGLAGSLHEHPPTDAQLDAVVKLCVWAIKSDDLPNVTSITQVLGHRDYTSTICPGWSSVNSGNWKDTFYTRLRRALGIEDTTFPPPATLTSMHLQNSVDGWVDWVRQVQPAVVKFTSAFERASEVKAVSPNTLVWIRQVNDNTGQYLGTQGYDYTNKPAPATAARMFLSTFWPEGETPGWVPHVDIISGLNETIATNNPSGTRSAVAFEVAFSDLVASLNTHVKASLLATAVGNPGHNEVELLLPAAEAAVRNSHYLDYHMYFPCNPSHANAWMESEGLHHHLRSLLSWDPVFNAHGLYPLYLAGECGAIGAFVREDTRPGGYVDFTAGWRHSQALNGNWQRYLTLLLRHQQLIKDWNAIHNNRFRGMTVFTFGGGSKWTNFELNNNQRNELATALGTS